MLTSPLTDDYADAYADGYGRVVRMFTPPTERETINPDHRLLRFLSARTRSFSVLVRGTEVVVRDYPTHPDDWEDFDMVLLGGHQHEIDEGTEALLRAAGLPDSCFWARG